MHHSIGNGLIEKDFTRMGLTGFLNSASPIILNPNTFSSFCSDKAPIPDWKDLINEKEEAAGAKVEKFDFKRFAILPPPLFEAICDEDLSPEATLE